MNRAAVSDLARTPMDRRTLLGGIGAMGLAACSPASPGKSVALAAAADLQYAIEEVAALFRADSGIDARLSLGSTGNFAR